MSTIAIDLFGSITKLLLNCDYGHLVGCLIRRLSAAYEGKKDLFH